MRLWTIAIALLLSFSLAPAQAQAQDVSRRGRALLQEFCGQCHAIGRRDRSKQATAVPFRHLGRNFNLDEFPRMLRRGISSSHPDMPEFKFKAEDARAAVVYLRSIQE
jgi:mono/diheme cytochrome c family protein